MRIEMARSEVWFASHANRKSVNQRYSHSPKMHQASQRRTRRLQNEGQAPAKAMEMEMDALVRTARTAMGCLRWMSSVRSVNRTR